MKNSTTELVFIMDRSGSMQGLEKDTIGGFNSLIEKQRKIDGECYVSTVLFDNESKVIHDRVRLSEVALMTEKDYYVGGCTALMDALGGAVKHISNIHKYARKEDVPEHTMFVIITDGLENASRQFSSDEVKRLIEDRKSRFSWEFIFLGANIDSVQTAARYGIDAPCAVDYHSDERGTGLIYDAVSAAVTNARKGVRAEKGKWREEVDKDFRSR